MQDGGQDLVNGLNLVPGEADHLHGVGHSSEVSAVVDGRLEGGRETEVVTQTSHLPGRVIAATLPSSDLPL